MRLSDLSQQERELVTRWRTLTSDDKDKAMLHLVTMAAGTAPEAPQDTLRRYYLSGNRLTVDEAAYLAGVSTRTIRRWYHAGRIAAETIGGKLMIDKDSLTAWRETL